MAYGRSIIFSHWHMVDGDIDRIEVACHMVDHLPFAIIIKCHVANAYCLYKCNDTFLNPNVTVLVNTIIIKCYRWWSNQLLDVCHDRHWLCLHCLCWLFHLHYVVRITKWVCPIRHTVLGVRSETTLRWLRFGEFPRPVGSYCSYLLPIRLVEHPKFMSTQRSLWPHA